MAQYFNRTQLITKGSKGFTLIEIMITIAILGIIAAVAWPSYERYQQKSRRADGISAMLTQSANLEKCFINYAENLGYTHANCAITTTIESGYYTIAISNLAAETYTLTATPAGAQAGDGECGTLSITHLGVKDVSPTNIAPDPVGTVKRCWSQ